MALKTFRANDNKVIDGGNNKTNKTIVNLSKKNKSKTLIYMLNIRVIGKFIFLTFNTKKIFNHLR